MKECYKTIVISILLIGCGVALYFFGFMVNLMGKGKQPKVELPEEYKLITKDTPIQGYYRNDSLIIEFKHE